MSAPQLSDDDGPFVASTPHDPLAALLAIEASGAWPASRPAYQSRLRDLAQALGERDEGARSAIYTWLEQECGGLLRCRDPRERKVRREALEDIAYGDETPEALLLAADRVYRPNLLSFLQAKLIWRANDKLESQHRRHARRVALVPDPTALDSRVARPYRASNRRRLLEQIFAGFEMTDLERRVLHRIARGDSIAEIARRTGRSRQQIYRLLQRAREWCTAAPAREVGR